MDRMCLVKPFSPICRSPFYCRPLFNRVEIDLPPPPGQTYSKKLTVISLGGPKLPYVKSVEVNGVLLDEPIITHEQIADGGLIVFTMSPTIEEWGNDPEVLQALDANVGQLVSASQVLCCMMGKLNPLPGIRIGC